MLRQVFIASALVLLCAGLVLAKPKVQVRKIKIENLQLLTFCITVLLCSRRMPPLRKVRTGHSKGSCSEAKASQKINIPKLLLSGSVCGVS